MCEWSWLVAAAFKCSNNHGLSKATFVILQQPGVPLLNLKICHFQNVQLHVIRYDASPAQRHG